MKYGFPAVGAILLTSQSIHQGGFKETKTLWRYGTSTKERGRFVTLTLREMIIRSLQAERFQSTQKAN
jgi:hypothetical protein